LDDAIGTYVAAWNEQDPARRRDLLERSLIGEVEVVHPSWGRSHGIDAISEQIGRYQSAMPGTTIGLTSGIDVHNELGRYEWKVFDERGQEAMAGIDVVEIAGDGRLKRILMFHGPLPPAE
jgi:hypothetical protein